MQELRHLVVNFPKFPGVELMKPASVCHKGFPGNFNLSFTENEMIEAFGQYLNYDRDMPYSKIQPVIRFQDWPHIESADEHSYRYLSLFDMADIGGALIFENNQRLEEITRFSINALSKFLFEDLDLDKTKIRISYFSGDNLTTATKGKYNFDFFVPADNAIEHWKEQGLHSSQFIPDNTRDTLLSLNIYGLPSPWGYRHEVNYLHENSLLDIATIEHFIYRPIFSDEKIVDLSRWNHSVSFAVVGLERLLMAKNNFTRVTDCAHIKPLVESILQVSNTKIYEQAEILCQALRVIHRIINDCGTYQNLSSKRKDKLRCFYKAALSSHINLDINLNKEQLFKWLNLNAELQNFYPELTESAERTAQEIVEANERFKSDNTRKNIQKVVT